ncbi:MAG: LLM class flavin-dependent oxidoreductase [Blastocatellia bacterium]|nr:LLM class flavin-dependent oxidoreductase [Blastocatellia bacterium]
MSLPTKNPKTTKANIEDIYALSPMQQGMLFHSVYAKGSGEYFQQFSCDIEGELNIEIFEQVWQELVNIHPILRTVFIWENRKKPLQVVYKQVKISIKQEDWQAFSTDEQKDRLLVYLAEDRNKSFNLSKAPLMRLTLIQMGIKKYRFIWSHHHIILDGWSIPIVLEQLFLIYESLNKGQKINLPYLPNYRSYIDWLDKQNLEKAKQFWSNLLLGFTTPTKLSIENTLSTTSKQEVNYNQEESLLSKDQTTNLQTCAKQYQLPMNVLIQGAWGLLLNHYSNESDIVYGSVVSGRPTSLKDTDKMIGLFINTLPVRIKINKSQYLTDYLKQLHEQLIAIREYEYSPLSEVQTWSQIERGQSLFDTILVYENYPIDFSLQEYKGALSLRNPKVIERTNLPITVQIFPAEQILIRIIYDSSRFEPKAINQILEHLKTILREITLNPNQLLSQVSLMSQAEKEELLYTWNNTYCDYDREITIHQLFEHQVIKSPSSTAIIFEDKELSYKELNEKANQLAHFLRKLGVTADSRVGLLIDRSSEMMIALLAILKAGAAYVPLDSSYPKDRISYMIDDAQLSVLITQDSLSSLASLYIGNTVFIDNDWKDIEKESTSNLVNINTSENLAYIIYTSGSTGKPKGVMISHRNVINFFVGMEQRIGKYQDGVWLAVTSISFDISVLELFWTLSRGFKVVIQSDSRGVVSLEKTRKNSSKKMDFSLFYFASDDSTENPNDKYKLLIDGAKFADEHNFSAVWTPERHFHTFGGLYPSPAVVGSAISTITSNIQIRAGSVVLPLNSPVRVTEEWSVIDNLSKGRVGLSFASGWHADDFVFAPDNYSNRRDIMFRDIETVRKLWRGEAISFKGGAGNNVAIRILPKPIQKELPVWVTAAGSPSTFQLAGEVGANLLTNLLGQSIEELSEKIKIYRQAWQNKGYPGDGYVSLMVHTYVGKDSKEAKERVRKPFINYLRTSLDLIRNLGKSLGVNIDAENFTKDDLDALLEHAFERYFDTSGLLGNVETCVQIVEKLKEIGVDEVACLIDFGISYQHVMEGLSYLDQVRLLTNSTSLGYSITEQIKRHKVSHLQCTPSLARVLTTEEEAKEAIKELKMMMVGGEALTTSLAKELINVIKGELHNMYGPTETTIWSSTHKVEANDRILNTVTIGKPIANTQIYIVNEALELVPVGVAGELLIAGEGVVKGYFQRPELTEEKFIANPFSKSQTDKLYRTGDLARWLDDGTIEFLGRLDHQVKIRGFRIELGEIETLLLQHPAVKESVVIARQDKGDNKEIVAYLRINSDHQNDNLDNFSSTHVSQWQTIWDEIYRQATPTDPTFNIAGWNSSYTSQPIPENEMKEWVEHTTKRILDLNPSHVLEIGCGTGLLLFRIAPQCSYYLGTDIHDSSINYIKQHSSTLPQVSLYKKPANDFSEIPKNSFDLVVINSVAQYFPSIEYFFNVIKEAIKTLKPQGKIFLGDIRNFLLLDLFHLSVQYYQASKNLTLSQLKQRLEKQITNEEELTISPEFFLALKELLPEIKQIKILPKRGVSHNEVTLFRYDVILYTDLKPIKEGVNWLDWQQEPFSLLELERKLKEEKPETLAIKNIFNAKINKEIMMRQILSSPHQLETITDLEAKLTSTSKLAINPEELWQLGQSCSYDVELSLVGSNNEAFYHAFLSSKNITNSLVIDFPCSIKEIKPLTSYSNKPFQRHLAHQVITEVKTTLKEKLPEYMLPSAIVVLEKLPLTPNGKVDRKALPAPEYSRSDQAYVAPSTPTELALAEIWKEVLGVEKVGINDSFFELGGHSILAMQLFTKIRNNFVGEISLRKLLESPTIAQLAQLIELSKTTLTSEQTITILPRDIDLPLSFTQERLWFLSQLEPDNAAYNDRLAIEIKGSLNFLALEESLNQIIERHEALRTNFAFVNGNPVQIIAKNRVLELSQINLENTNKARLEEELEELFIKEGQKLFNLSEDLLLRASLIKINPHHHILLLVLSHTVWDGWSFGVFVKEIATLYQSYTENKTPELAKLPIQYADYAYWQRQWMQGEVFEKQLAYWKEKLVGKLSPLQLPIDKPHPPIQTFAGRRFLKVLPSKLLKEIQQLSRNNSATLFMTLLAAFQTLLYRYSGSEDILVGSPIANRNHPDIENLIGVFINTLVMRSDLSSNPTFEQLLARVKDVTLGAYSNQDIPFEALVEKLQPERDLSRSPFSKSCLFFKMLLFLK